MRNKQPNGRHVKRRPGRAGLTLIELLVVVAIVGSLIAMLLPAVQRIREAARRVQCQNNLRQLALGTLNYSSVHGDYLPPLWKTANFFPWDNFSWRVDILPFIETGNLQQTMELDELPFSPANLSAVETQLSVFQCPSTPSALRAIDTIGISGASITDLQVAACDYSAIFETAPTRNVAVPCAWHPPGLGEGISAPVLRTQPSSLTSIGDGLSSTILLFEQAAKPDVYDRQRSIRNTTILNRSEGPWATVEQGIVFEYQINDSNVDGLYGFHVVSHIALCDASVHALATDVESSVVAALLTRNGREIIDASDWQ